VCAWRETVYCYEWVEASGDPGGLCLPSFDVCAKQQDFDSHAYTITLACRAM
jgi:hypothetical protein